MRLRWYGEAGPTARSVRLEFKQKSGLVGRKRVHALADFDVADVGPRALRDLYRASELDGQLVERLAGLHATLRNRYRRAYFRSADGRFRVTLDTCLQYASARGPAAFEDRPAERPCVLEVKYDRAAEADVQAITSAFPFRLTKSSKYVSGLLANRARAGLA